MLCSTLFQLGLEPLRTLFSIISNLVPVFLKVVLSPADGFGLLIAIQRPPLGLVDAVRLPFHCFNLGSNLSDSVLHHYKMQCALALEIKKKKRMCLSEPTQSP